MIYLRGLRECVGTAAARATRFPLDPKPFRILRLLICRVVFAVATELLISAVVTGILALVNGNLQADWPLPTSELESSTSSSPLSAAPSLGQQFAGRIAVVAKRQGITS
jgi:hypothetical protein